jgi:hypothetical protein
VTTGSRTGRVSIPTDIERHFDNGRIREILNALTLEELGVASTAGRKCVRIRAIPSAGRLWPHWVPHGADEYELHADPEQATVLKLIARYKGVEFEDIEVTNVTFDEPLEDALFTYDPRGGEQVAPAPPIVERLTVAAAAVRMPFTVFVPSRLPDAEHAQLNVHYLAPRGPGGSGWSSLQLMYFYYPRSIWLNLDESAAPNPSDGEYEWEEVEIAGRQFRLSDPGSGGRRLLSFEQEGTHIRICSDVDRATLLDIALSLTAVPKSS